MREKYLIRPERLRQIPSGFSWVDHRLVRDRHIERLSHQASALYLFLVTVADCQGLSYYSDGKVAELLALNPDEVREARRQLLAAGMIAYARPLYQVLALGGAS